MRLIDADALIAKLKDDMNHMDDGIVILYTQVEINDIEHAPTVDAVEVIRCRDCKHVDKYYHCIFSTTWKDKNHYCGQGERRNG